MTNIQWYEHGVETERKIALTFDDGPNPYCAETILEILEGKGVRGNFFVVGKWVDRWPDLVKRMAQRHVIGNHSYKHENPARDYEEAEATLSNVLGRESVFARAPYFHYSDELLRWLGPRNLIGSDVRLNDWEADTTADAMFEMACANTKPGSIILLHDGSENEAELETRPLEMISALPRIIDYLQGQGFSLVGLDQMTFEKA